MMLIATVIAAMISALTAMISAGIAYQARRDITKADRERRLREVSLLANKIATGVADVNELAQRLKTAYEASFNMAGRSQSGILSKIVSEIERDQETVEPLQKEAQDLIKDGLEAFRDEQITAHLLKLDGYLVQVERIRRIFDTKLVSVESQNTRLAIT